MLSQIRLSQTVKNHYIIPKDLLADHPRKSFERALIWMSEGVLSFYNLNIGLLCCGSVVNNC